MKGPMRVPLRLLMLIALAAAACQGVAEPTGSPANAPLQSRVEHYEDRYGLEDPYAKATDNHGQGAKALYGTRNFRVVLHGIAYRGGANNKWHREQPRNNMNPLPEDALRNLCQEGFSQAVYLYDTNFATAPRQTKCASKPGADNELSYIQRSASHAQESYEILASVYETIRDTRNGPVYLHCWNGWHASGLAAAKILRQFCGVSAADAVAYWEHNTDGHNTEPRYESIRQKIRDFVPYPEFTISDSEAALICPSLENS